MPLKLKKTLGLHPLQLIVCLNSRQRFVQLAYFLLSAASLCQQTHIPAYRYCFVCSKAAITTEDLPPGQANNTLSSPTC